MGLPEINIIFKTKGLTAIQRSERGIVPLSSRMIPRAGSL